MPHLSANLTLSAPHRLFKYLEEEWAIALVERGEIKIGTLHEYQAIDSIDSARSDPDEGRLRYQGTFTARGVTRQTRSPWLKRYFGWVKSGTFEHVEVDFRETTANCYVYCMSEVWDRSVMALFPGSDSCVVISDPRRFLNCVAIGLGVVWPEAYLSRCEYGSRERPPLSPVEPEAVFLKEPRHRLQHEWRAVFSPTAEKPFIPKEPAFLTIPELTKYCRLAEPFK